ncbi:MAG: molybdopterin-guanine dinucleotide biosynthesis protein MobB [Pedobacter sp.]|jgi:hypothetical protein|uniref:Molybdopterin-guanine dinucleotide biosynthesis protein MobB n=1 Tax=Pedobacter duraquae TaxID=425511 RepID=A0A4V3C3W9_9SPHI|nr:DUF5712 family protein [Pedobacter duraquae]RZK77000.1 MAG: molybdopterin-guanine dinucleotide biosynthesis protein MobB [Pedobacter sp.]TDO23718.1 hypothetical protein CLV32_0002 [Pedobacter duraquae]
MYINITASETGNNKGSSGALVNYLEKENELKNGKNSVPDYENWFNGLRNDIRRQEVRVKVDNNIAKLSRDDSKFFLINISPSQKELEHLFNRYGDNGAKEKLKEFAAKVMDEYAKNFKRPGIITNNDLLWFGKVENYRYYKHTDKEVKNGTKQKGDRKEGRQMHVQVIVSRKDLSNKVKLSPQNTSKGKNEKHSAKLGQFNRSAFKQSGEEVFDNLFKFERGLKDKFIYANVMENGTPEQKTQMQMISELSIDISRDISIDSLTKGISDGVFANVTDLITTVKDAGIGVLEILMEPTYESPQTDSAEESEKRRRKKLQQSQGRIR